MAALSGKCVMITGAGSGLGRSHANLLAERGADIIIQDIKAAGAEETADMVRGHGRNVHLIICDVRDSVALKSGAKAGSDALGPVDILVNNAGISGQRLAFEDITEQVLADMFDINVKGAYLATATVLPSMKERRAGRIINTASMFGMTGTANASHYSGAKAAIIGLTKSWAKEFAPWNILVNAVAPGMIPTPMTIRPGYEAARAERAKIIPLGHEGEPIDISYAVAYFASEEGKYLTGQVLSPNGGAVIS